jgi:hypothetical protein
MSSLTEISPCSSLLIIFGYGDGKLIQECIDDPAIRQKDIWLLAFGEEVPERKWPERTRFIQIRCWEDAQAWVNAAFSDHNDIVRLGGVDICLSEGLAAAAEVLREALMPRTTGALSDRSWALGNDINDSFTGLWHAAQNAALVLPAPSIGQIAGAFGNLPAISIGAGPSVGAHLEALRALQDKCLLVACDSVCPGLVKEGIIPHVVTPLERSQQQAQFVECLRGTRAIFAGIPACHPDTLAPFGDRMIYLHALDKVYDWLSPDERLRCITGSSTGVLSFFVAASLTRGPVYLLGHDLAKEDGQTHWAGADFAGKAFAKEATNAGGFGSNGYEERLIPGNSGKLLTSIFWWDNFRSEIASQAKVMGPRVFNVNAHDGKYALIEHTLPAPLPDPDSLPFFSTPEPKRVNQARYDSWKERASKIGQDADSFIAGMHTFREQVEAMRYLPAHQWNLDALMERVTPEAHVSAGNLAAFQYFLRSAIYNEQAYGCFRARGFSSRNEAYWTTMRSLDGLADGMARAVEHLRGVLWKISAL